MSSPARPARNQKQSASEQTPREFFEAVFEVLSEELERNPSFAMRLAERLDGVVSVSVRPARRPGVEAPSALTGLDLKAEREELGEAGLREKIGNFRNSELASFIRARKLSDSPLSKRPKNSLVNIIMRAAR